MTKIKFLLSISFLFFSCEDVKQDNTKPIKSAVISKSNVDSPLSEITLKSISSESSILKKDLLGKWNAVKFIPIADIYGFSENDFKKLGESYAVNILGDSILFAFPKRSSSYDSIEVKAYEFEDFITHLGYESYNKQSKDLIKSALVISFTKSLEELYFINHKFYFESDGVLVEIIKK